LKAEIIEPDKKTLDAHRLPWFTRKTKNAVFPPGERTSKERWPPSRAQHKQYARVNKENNFTMTLDKHLDKRKDLQKRKRKRMLQKTIILVTDPLVEKEKLTGSEERKIMLRRKSRGTQEKPENCKHN